MRSGRFELEPRVTVAQAGKDSATPTSASARTPMCAGLRNFMKPLNGLQPALPRRTYGLGCTWDASRQSSGVKFIKNDTTGGRATYSAA